MIKVWLKLEARAEDVLEQILAADYRLVSETLRRHTESTRRIFEKGAAKVDWFEHHMLGLRGLEITEDASLAAALESMFAPPSRRELVATASEAAPLEAIRALRLLAAQEYPTPASDTVAAARRLVDHEDPFVRRAVSSVLTLGRWPALEDRFRERVLDDPELSERWRSLLREDVPQADE
jgi:hypothetical protein